uniref:PH domain-containing protein n=1 Tax=Plectus sambesii TaxID=2011161 RepID=A0A914XGC3_9BILA
MSAILKQGPVFKHVDKARWSDAWYILRRTSNGPEIQLFKDSSAKKAFGDAIAISKDASSVRFGKTAKAIEKAPECGKDVRLCDEAFIALTHEKVQKKGAPVKENVWLCALSTSDMFELLRLIASVMHASDHAAPPPADDDENIIGSDCVPTAFVPANDWERFWVNPPTPEVSPPVVSPPKKLKKSKSVDALNDVKVDQKNSKQRTTTVTLDDSKLDDRKRRESTTSVLSNESHASSVAATEKKGKNDKKKEPKIKEKSEKKKNNQKEAEAADVAAEAEKVEELTEEKPQKKEKPKVAPKPKLTKERKRSSSTSSSSSVEEKPKIDLVVVPGNKNRKDKTPNDEDKKPIVVHSEVQTDSDHSISPPHRAAINPPPAGYGAVVDQLKSKDATKANGAKPVSPPVPPPKQQQLQALPLPKSSLPNSDDGSSSEDEASFEDALERGQSLMQKPKKSGNRGEYTVSQFEVNDKEEKLAKHTVVYDQNGHDIERHSVEIASSRY